MRDQHHVCERYDLLYYLITYVESVIHICESNELEQTCCLADLCHINVLNSICSPVSGTDE